MSCRTLWFRNTWWRETDGVKPSLEAKGTPGQPLIVAHHPDMGEYPLTCDRDVPLLFTENETNEDRLSGQPNTSPLRQGRHQRRGRARQGRGGERVGRDEGRRVYTLPVPAGGTEVIRLRLGAVPEGGRRGLSKS